MADVYEIAERVMREGSTEAVIVDALKFYDERKTLARALLAQKAVVEAAVAYVGLLDVIRSIDGEQDGSDAAWQALHDAEERGDMLWKALVDAVKEQAR